MTLADYIEDHQPPYARRVYLRGFEGFDPAAIPWADLRLAPKGTPGIQVAKLSSVRMVLSLNYTRPDGDVERVFLKRSLVKSLKKRIGEMLRSSKEWREFNTAVKFRSQGINVPLPVFYSEMVGPDGVPVRFIATKALAPNWKSAKKCFKDGGSDDRSWLLLAQFTRSLHSAGILHGDYRSDHIYINVEGAEDSPATENCALIDLDGSSISAKVARKERVRSLRQLAQSLIGAGLSREDMKNFIKVYDSEDHFAIGPKEIFDYARERHEMRMAIRAQEGD